MRLPNPYSLEETLEKLRHSLTAASNEDALTLLEKGRHQGS
jgi:CheY-like chemotaxis protein